MHGVRNSQCRQTQRNDIRDVVNVVQRMIRPVKVGHAGTLDPLATGVLVLLVGRATRLTEYIHLQETYVVPLSWGK